MLLNVSNVKYFKVVKITPKLITYLCKAMCCNAHLWYIGTIISYVTPTLHFALNNPVGHLTLRNRYGHSDTYFRPKTCTFFKILLSLILRHVSILDTSDQVRVNKIIRTLKLNRLPAIELIQMLHQWQSTLK